MNQTLERSHHGEQRPVRQSLVTAAIIVLTAMALLWGWNTVAADFGGLPELQFRHALAPVLAAAGLAWLVKRV